LENRRRALAILNAHPLVEHAPAIVPDESIASNANGVMSVLAGARRV